MVALFNLVQAFQAFFISILLPLRQHQQQQQKTQHTISWLDLKLFRSSKDVKNQILSSNYKASMTSIICMSLLESVLFLDKAETHFFVNHYQAGEFSSIRNALHRSPLRYILDTMSRHQIYKKKRTSLRENVTTLDTKRLSK